MSSSKNTKKKKHSFFLLKWLFGGKSKVEEMDLLQEELMQSPFRTIVRKFMENKLAMGALIVFLAIFLVVLIGPIFNPISLSEQEETQTNIGMGLDMMDVPKELQGNVKQISTGATFSVGVDNNGKVYVWGHTKISKKIDIKRDMPSQKELGNVVSVAAGFDHVVALNDEGEVICWGNNRLGQVKVPGEVERAKGIKQIAAGYQMSYALTEDGKILNWGNDNLNDVRITRKKGDGKIAKIVVSNTTLLALREDGKVVHMGSQKSDVSRVPEDLENVVDIAATSNSVAAVTEDGKIVTWGKAGKSVTDIPEYEGKITSIYGGKLHFTMLTDKGTVYSWGANNYEQIDVPKKATDVEAIYGNYYQNYAITKSGDVVTWGLKGYLLGTDELGRDVFGRLLNGGRMTMTIGAVAVIISTFIGIIVGGISGFFGGWIDIILQRITEITASLPFLPMAMILNAIIGNSLSEDMRIFLIMVILGLLSWPSLARLVRAQVLAEREKEFVTAANAMGVKRGSIVFRHIIPNVISVIIVSATLGFASCMLTESSLSFLGFGVKLPRPTWGNMLNGCVNSVVIQNYWWRWVFPAIMLSICVICINMVGDGLRDAIDPKSNER
ncbi:MAG: ABC transporter permease subunit [Clostridiales bacterium]|nr:ABC transporter permease subunit [Clostridiales bacterium]